MAAVGDQNDEVFKVFEMHFNQTIRLEHLIRSGSQIQPIHADLRVPHDPTRTSYEEAMENPDGPEPKPFDFYIGQNDLINPKLSSGLSLYASEEAFPLKFDLDPRNLWNLNRGTPFPVEMRMRYIGANHYGIIPQEGVKPATFKEMLKCLPWVKRYRAFEAEQRRQQLRQQRAPRP